MKISLIVKIMKIIALKVIILYILVLIDLNIGEKFNNKYEVIQKLGWGHFSTVWLIKTINRQQYYALKVQRSKPNHAETAIDEIQLLKILRQHENDAEWIKLIQNGFGIQCFHVANAKEIYRPLLLIDNFAHHGMHGKHYCSAFQLMGPNLLDIIQHYQFKRLRMPLSLVKQITIDVLIGLVYLHNFCKMIHTDLKPENIMVKLTAEEQRKVVQGLKSYKKKPLSMKFLYKIKAKNPQKNKKKYQKKKLKKKAQKEQQQNKINQNNGEQLNETQQTSKNIENPKLETPHIQQSSISEVTRSETQSEPKQKINQPQIQYQQPPKQLQQQKSKKKKKRNKKKNKNNKKDNNNQSKVQQTNKNKNSDDDYSQYSDEQTKVYSQQEIDNLEWKKIKIYLHQGLTFKIADYGNATLHEKHFSQEIQTREYRAPEVILGLDYEYNTDIWSLACVIYEMLTNSFLFKPKHHKKISKDEDHIYKMIQLLGPMNKNFALGGLYSKEIMNKKGDLLNGNPSKLLTITELLHEDYHYSLTDAQQIEAFLRPMLQYEPSKRINALQCLKSEWLWKK